MHPSQAHILQTAQNLAAPKTAAGALWKYTCPETGDDFYLAKKMVSVRSPFTGKTFSAKPEKASLGEVGKELKDDAKADKKPKAKKASELGLDPEAVAADILSATSHPALGVLMEGMARVQQTHTAACALLRGSGGKVSATDTIKPLIAAVEGMAEDATLLAAQLNARTQE